MLFETDHIKYKTSILIFGIEALRIIIIPWFLVIVGAMTINIGM